MTLKAAILVCVFKFLWYVQCLFASMYEHRFGPMKTYDSVQFFKSYVFVLIINTFLEKLSVPL